MADRRKPMTDNIDPDAHTHLDFEPLDSEPTGRADGLAYSGEQVEAEEDYQYSPENAPTAIVMTRSGTPLVVGAVVLAVAAIICATVLAVLRLTKPSSSPVSAPTMTTVTMLTTTSVAPPPPPPPAAPTVTVTTKVVVSKLGTPCAGSSGYNLGKLSTDPATDRIIVCGWDEGITIQIWQPVTEPLVGTVKSGSACLPSQQGQSARSTYNYLVSCTDPGMSQGFIWIGGDY